MPGGPHVDVLTFTGSTAVMAAALVWLVGFIERNPHAAKKPYNAALAIGRDGPYDRRPPRASGKQRNDVEARVPTRTHHS